MNDKETVLTASIIIAVAIVVFGMIIKPDVRVIEKENDEYRFQFIKNDDTYIREGVFDRKYGILYRIGNNETRKATAINFTTGELYGKDRVEKEWDDDFKIQCEAKIIWKDVEVEK